MVVLKKTIEQERMICVWRSEGRVVVGDGFLCYSKRAEVTAIYWTRGYHDADGGFIRVLRFHVCCMNYATCDWDACMLSHSVTQSWSDPMDHSPPDSSVHGILQARILEWVAMPSSRGSSPPRNQTHNSYIACGFFTPEPLGKPMT